MTAKRPLLTERIEVGDLVVRCCCRCFYIQMHPKLVTHFKLSGVMKRFRKAKIKSYVSLVSKIDALLTSC